MPPKQHATLSASSAHRWLHCTPSAQLEAGKPDRDTEASREGTAAHALAEHKLRKHLGKTTRKPKSKYQCDEMDKHTDEYVQFVLDQISEMGEPSVFIEQILDFSQYVPRGFGTGDCILISDGMLHIIDLKYGQGVLVDAHDNPQLRLYAMGAVLAFNLVYDIDTVRMTIFQPRRGNTSSETLTVSELTDWCEHVVKHAAILASKGEGEFQVGDWCQFCKLAPTCRARAEHNLQLAQDEFTAPAELDDTELARILQQLPGFMKWARDVEKYALTEATEHGKKWDGMKLVAGRSVRKFADENRVISAAQEAGYTDIFERRLLTLTAMEKLMGKKDFTKILGDLIIRPTGKPSLVPESDKRPELAAATAEEEFKNIGENS